MASFALRGRALGACVGPARAGLRTCISCGDQVSLALRGRALDVCCGPARAGLSTRNRAADLVSRRLRRVLRRQNAGGASFTLRGRVSDACAALTGLAYTYV